MLISYNHKAVRLIYDIQMYHGTGNLKSIWLLINIRITYYQQISGEHFLMHVCSVMSD